MLNGEERKFLHDLANPVAIAQGNIKLVHRALQKDPESWNHDSIREKLSKAAAAFDRVTDLMNSRRMALIEEEGA